MFEAIAARRDQGAVDRVHEPRPVAARSATGARRARDAQSSWCCRRRIATPTPRRFADVLLPAASWAEKDGTVTNSERRITRVRAAVPPPGEARADWAIAADFAHRLGERLGRTDAAAALRVALRRRRSSTSTARRRSAAISTSAASTTRSSSATDRSSGRCRRAPQPGARASTPTACSRPRAAARGSPTRDTSRRPKAPDSRFPLLLNTGRLRDQWHGMSRTGTVAQLFGHTPRPALDMHPDDLAARGLRSGDLVRVASRRGELVVAVQASTDVRPGEAFMAMHWGSRFMRGAGANALTVSAFDPLFEAAGAQARRGRGDEGRPAVRGRRRSRGSSAGAARGAAARCSSASRTRRWCRSGATTRSSSSSARDDGAPTPETLAALDAALGFAAGRTRAALR